MFIPDFIKLALIRLNRLQGNLEKRGIVVYEDRIRLRSPLYHRRILFNQEGHDRVSAQLDRNEPIMVSRLGSVELSCLRYYLEARSGRKSPYSARIRSQMANPAGFFPTDDASLDAFAELYLEVLPHVDLLGVWFNLFEEVVCNEWCPAAELVDISCLEPFWFTMPWSMRLAGKTVLVVHPFAESIRKQYTEKRELLFESPDLLPTFELKTYKAVQSIAGSTVKYATWFDAYRHMCDGIARIDFDICIIGAGAYGLPLAAFVKRMGKQAIHLGGVTQILFGIKGRRWEKLYADSTAKLFNEHWVRPRESETPENRDNIENGCYW
jgi:hypothetical protein